MSGSGHQYPSSFQTSQTPTGMHNPLANQFNNSTVSSLPGTMTSGLQFDLGPNPTNPSQNSSSSNQVPGSQTGSQQTSTTPNSNTSDSMSSNPQSNSNSVTGRTGPTNNASDSASQVSQSTRDINTASLCRIGQETVQDIVSRTQEIFQTLKTIQPPNGTIPGANTSSEKKRKIQEQLGTIRILFKRLRLIYEKCNENTQLQGMEYTHIESLIPLKEEWDMKSEERKNSEAYRQASEECKELVEQVALKNKHLKEIVDHLRRIIWEINTMLAMRRS